jgi:hypothetical protein
MNKHLKCIDAYGTYGIAEQSSIVCCWDGSYPTIPNGVHQDSAWATHGVSTEAYAWKTCTRVRWALNVSLASSWMVATCGALLACVCCVIMFIPLQGLLLIQISMTFLDMGDGLFAVFKRSNSTFIMLLISWDVIDYLVVDEKINISQLFDYNCMFSIGCKHILLTT